VKEIQREQVLVQVDDALTAFKQKEGHSPSALSDLVTKGYLSAIPPDPMGGVIFIDEDGRSASTSSNLRLEPIDYRKKMELMEKQKAQQQGQSNAPNSP
jgi:hypothetical protein